MSVGWLRVRLSTVPVQKNRRQIWGKIILIGATKGGVGKTVSTYNLAYSLASMGKKVLAVDFDSQANLTTCFGVEDTWAISTTIGHLMMLQLDDEELPI